jgi:hypothetical protein
MSSLLGLEQNMTQHNKSKIYTRQELARLKRLLKQIPLHRQMRQDNLISQANFKNFQQLQQLQNERQRVIGFESNVIPSLRYRVPVSSGGSFANSKNRLEQLEAQMNQLHFINKTLDRY